MPTENYSHMMMEDEHMVHGDGVGDDDGEEALEIPLSGVENRNNQPPKTKIMVVAALWFAKSSVLLAGYFFEYIRTCTKGEAKSTTEAQTDSDGAAFLLGRTT
jgi:hypothetical protein